MEWVVVANSNECRIFKYTKRPKKLELFKKICLPSAREKGSDLVSDRPGHYVTRTRARGAFASHSDPKEVEVEKFGIKIAKEINNGRKKELYEQLTVFAPSHMIGLINKHLPDSLQDYAKTIKKNYTHLNEAELMDVLKPSGGKTG